MKPLVTVTRARHAWREKDGFTINRPRGIREYTFLHFFNPVDLLVEEKIQQVPPHSCIFYATDTPQWFRSIGPLQHDWMHMTGDVAASLEAVGLPENVLIFPESSRFITEIHRELEFEVLSKPPQYQQLVYAKYQELLVKLARSCSGQLVTALRPSVEEQLRQVRSQVFTQLERAWTVAEMAELAYMSSSRFHALYRALFGISPVEDLIQARVDTAQYRLGSTAQSIHELAESLGYRNMTHFCRQFKQYAGVSPGEYRREQQG